MSIQPILNSLKAKAEQAQYSGSASLSNKSTTLLPETGGDDELAMYGGQTRILVSKILSMQNRKLKSTSSAAHTSTSSSPPAMSEEGYSPAESVPEVHPSLVDYLTMLPPPATLGTHTMDSISTDTSLQPTYDPTMPTKSPLLAFPHGTSPQPSFIPDVSSLAPSGYDHVSMTASNMTSFDSQSLGGGPEALSDIGDFEFMLSGEAGMNERWVSFMRESGIFGVR